MPQPSQKAASWNALTHALEAFTALRREPSVALGLDHGFIGKNALSDALYGDQVTLDVGHRKSQLTVNPPRSG